MWYYSYQQFGVDLMAGPTVGVVLIILVPLLCALLILRYAPCGEVPMRLAAAVPITFVGFASSAAWLDMIADKLVSLLSFFGIMLHIPATIMGLTVLAWGNSSQDLVANMTVARKGLSTMAITASFAGPVFNILVGLGIGLTILTQSNHNPGDPVPVSLNNPLRVGFIFSILNGILVITAGVVVGKGVVPKRYGYVAMILYTAYVICSLTL
jgi:sodium/potassium/calcium exchanger 6